MSTIIQKTVEFVDFLTRIHPGVAAFVLLAIVIWAIFRIWRIVKAVSTEIQRYTLQWSQEALTRSETGHGSKETNNDSTNSNTSGD